ncbi:hypothetical protein NBRC116187_26710 [Halopseudomonas sabulinigri]|uniref:Uncharacterized protein n=1 Tax=Halopseudomonas sabulinigri TaxID=472181 RepID=A0ABP9ZS88_9GAMM
MTYLNLQDRIKKSKSALKSYPDWAKSGCRFQGGGVIRLKPEEYKDQIKRTIKHA